MPSPDASDQQDVPGIVASQRAVRLSATNPGSASRARLLPGGEVDVLNVSETGLLVEGRSRPVVGTVVSIRLPGSRLKRLEGRIVRSRVSTIHRDGTLSYESAIEFDQSHAVQDLVNTGEEVVESSVDAASAGSDADVYIIDTDNDW